MQVTLVNQNGYEQNIEKYKTSSAGDRPNLVQMPEYTLQLLADSDTVVPVQSCVNADDYSLDDFLPRATAYYTLRGALQGMPFNLSNPVLYYNKATFAKAGLDPEKPPVSLDELRADSEKIVDSGAARTASPSTTASTAAAAGSWSSGWPRTTSSTPTTRTGGPRRPPTCSSPGRRASSC